MAEALGETDGVAVPVGVALALTVGAGDGTATLPGRTTSTARTSAANAAIRAPRRTGRFRVIWWAERESNPHSTKAADLQSAPVATATSHEFMGYSASINLSADRLPGTVSCPFCSAGSGRLNPIPPNRG